MHILTTTVEVKGATLAKSLLVDGLGCNPENKEEDDEEDTYKSQKLSNSRFPSLGLHTCIIPGKHEKESYSKCGNRHTASNQNKKPLLRYNKESQIKKW